MIFRGIHWDFSQSCQVCMHDSNSWQKLKSLGARKLRSVEMAFTKDTTKRNWTKAGGRGERWEMRDERPGREEMKLNWRIKDATRIRLHTYLCVSPSCGLASYPFCCSLNVHILHKACPCTFGHMLHGELLLLLCLLHIILVKCVMSPCCTSQCKVLFPRTSSAVYTTANQDHAHLIYAWLTSSVV